MVPGQLTRHGQRTALARRPMGAAFSPLLFGTLMRGLAAPGSRYLLNHFPGGQRLVAVPVWRLAFWACGLIGLAWATFFYLWFRDDPADKQSVNAAELHLISSGHPRPKHKRHDARIWFALFTSRSLWALAFVYVFGSFGFSFFLSWMPKFLKNVHHIDYDKSEWMSALPMFCAGISSLLGGWISDRIVRRTGRKRFGRAILPVAGSLFAAVAIFGLRYAHTAHQAVALMCITMAAYDLGLGPNGPPSSTSAAPTPASPPASSTCLAISAGTSSSRSSAP